MLFIGFAESPSVESASLRVVPLIKPEPQPGLQLKQQSLPREAILLQAAI